MQAVPTNWDDLTPQTGQPAAMMQVRYRGSWGGVLGPGVAWFVAWLPLAPYCGMTTEYWRCTSREHLAVRAHGRGVGGLSM